MRLIYLWYVNICEYLRFKYFLSVDDNVITKLTENIKVLHVAKTPMKIFE